MSPPRTLHWVGETCRVKAGDRTTASAAMNDFAPFFSNETTSTWYVPGVSCGPYDDWNCFHAEGEEGSVAMEVIGANVTTRESAGSVRFHHAPAISPDPKGSLIETRTTSASIRDHTVVGPRPSRSSIESSATYVGVTKSKWEGVRVEFTASQASSVEPDDVTRIRRTIRWPATKVLSNDANGKLNFS